MATHLQPATELDEMRKLILPFLLHPYGRNWPSVMSLGLLELLIFSAHLSVVCSAEAVLEDPKSHQFQHLSHVGRITLQM